MVSYHMTEYYIEYYTVGYMLTSFLLCLPYRFFHSLGEPISDDR